MAIRIRKAAGAALMGGLLLAGLAACGEPERRGPHGMIMSPPPLKPPPVSLAGEVLDPTPDVACWPATLAWFKATDSNGDGQLEAAEVLADTARFFARIDANGDKAITSIELTAYREKVAPDSYRDRPAPPERAPLKTPATWLVS